MDVASAVSGYISKMVSAGDSAIGSASSKMKILLLDSETVRVLDDDNRVLWLSWTDQHRIDCYNSICFAEP